MLWFTEWVRTVTLLSGLLMRSLKESFGSQPKTLGFSLAEMWFPVRCQNMPWAYLTEVYFSFYLVLRWMKDTSFVLPSAEMHVCVTCSRLLGPEGLSRDSRHCQVQIPFQRSPFLCKPLSRKTSPSHLSFLWLKPVFTLSLHRRRSWTLIPSNQSLCQRSDPPSATTSGLTLNLRGRGLLERDTYLWCYWSNLACPTASSYWGIKFNLQPLKHVCSSVLRCLGSGQEIQDFSVSGGSGQKINKTLKFLSLYEMFSTSWINACFPPTFTQFCIHLVFPSQNELAFEL